MAIEILITTIRTGSLKKGQQPVVSETYKRKPGQKITFTDFTRKKAGTLVCTASGGCFGSIIQRHLTPDTDARPKIIDIQPGQSDQFQIYQEPLMAVQGRYRVITVTSQTTSNYK